ncbi:hypothetical protein [Cohnella sp. GbtcB17]|uniref:hypothetical protein n=1 Tax=Cohnella sp. GbtcB17 TaxID=2824762 RepID=UPI001C302692|nr:hypothetical protein [Cohnella sp. GbtcB17]
MTEMHIQARLLEVRLKTAAAAWSAPLLDSGLWTHGDIRNNFYAASSLFAVCSDPNVEPPCDRLAGKALATNVLTTILALQDGDSGSPTYGHWPLGLHPEPRLAPINPLPAELMGCLLIWFADRYGAEMEASLAQAVETAIVRLHGSAYYRVAQRTFGHHEAKYTATKLLLGDRFADSELLEAGLRDLRLTLTRVREQGMAEYGALPWFWHWVQAFVCVKDVVRDATVRSEAAELLDALWLYRARHYLGGAWAGGRMRSLPADLPRDGNVAFDYVQFGDFALPDELLRVEYAGFLLHEAPAPTRRAALDRSAPEESKRLIRPAGEDRQPLHSYLYRAERFAVGGLLERAAEFDNEQHRWEVTLPLAAVAGANRLYFFPCGEGYSAGDPRHASEGGETFFHRGTAVALYPAAAKGVAGVLPKGEWIFRERGWFGYADGVLLAVYLFGECRAAESADRFDCEGAPGRHGFVVEAVDAAQAAIQLGIGESGDDPRGLLRAFADQMASRGPSWMDVAEAGDSAFSVEYETLDGDRLALIASERSSPLRKLNGETLQLADYTCGI